MPDETPPELRVSPPPGLLDDGDTTGILSHVLLIEDEDAHAALISRAVSPLVGELTRVSSGKDAIHAVESTLVDLVLCDLQLPDMTGIDIIRSVREIRPALPIIVLTSSSNPQDAVNAMREGAWDYLVKQFSSEFARSMELVLRRTADRKQQLVREMQLRSERRNFWAAAHAAQDGLAIVSAQGVVVFANPAFYNFCSFIDKTIQPNDPVNLVNLIEFENRSVAQTLKAQLSERRIDLLWEAELQISRHAGETNAETRYFELSITSAKFEEAAEGKAAEISIPELQRFVFWVRNITRRKEQERFQRDLLSTTSHDLKGPLGAILTSAELLNDDNFLRSDKGPELIMRIASCARNTINIIDELLSARRIQDGVLIVKPKWYEVNEFLEEVVLDFLPSARAKGIDLSYRAADSQAKVFADRMGLHRVLSNLVSNALKFTPRNGKVELFAERQQNEMRITVKDSGCGIEPNARHLLFQRYSRLEKHQEVEGTGLGLYVTRNIMNAHNGLIEIQSEVGRGTAFTLVLPDGPSVTV